jgi:hypothetical protein
MVVQVLMEQVVLRDLMGQVGHLELAEYREREEHQVQVVVQVVVEVRELMVVLVLMEQAVQVIQLSRAIFVQQLLLAVRLQAIQQLVFILHQEPQMEMELEILRHQSSQHLSEPHLVLV